MTKINRSGRTSTMNPECELITPTIIPTIQYSSHDNKTSIPIITNNNTNGYINQMYKSQSNTSTDTSHTIKYENKRNDFPTVDKKYIARHKVSVNNNKSTKLISNRHITNNMQVTMASNNKSKENNSMRKRLKQEINSYDSYHNTNSDTSLEMNYKPRSKTITNYSNNNINYKVDSDSNNISYSFIRKYTEATKNSICRLRHIPTLQKK